MLLRLLRISCGYAIRACSNITIASTASSKANCLTFRAHADVSASRSIEEGNLGRKFCETSLSFRELEDCYCSGREARFAFYFSPFSLSLSLSWFNWRERIAAREIVLNSTVSWNNSNSGRCLNVLFPWTIFRCYRAIFIARTKTV